MKVVEVVWDDAWTDDGDFDDAKVSAEHKPIRLRVVGHLVKQTEAGVSLAMETAHEGDDYRVVRFIPTGMIVKINTLRK